MASSANPTFGNVGNTDQRSKIGTFNISPTYTRIISNDMVFNLGGFVRRDDYNYYPSGNPLADLGPTNLQTSSIAQNRTLTNTAVHSDLSYVKGIHNIKVGAQYGQTFLREHDSLGVVDATYNSPCVDAGGNPLPGYTDPVAMSGRRGGAESELPGCACSLRPDARAERFITYFGHTDVKELALFAEDEIKAGQLGHEPGAARGRL